MEVKEKLSKEECINLFKEGKINRKNIKNVIPTEYLNDKKFWNELYIIENIDLFNFLDLIPQGSFGEDFYFNYLKDNRTTAGYAKKFLPTNIINDYSFWHRFNVLHKPYNKYIDIIPENVLEDSFYLNKIKNKLDNYTYEKNFYGLDKMIPKRLFYSPKFWLDVINLNIPTSTDVLEYAPDIIRDNYSVMLAAIKKNSYCLEEASDRLKNNIRLVMLAISKNSYNFNFTSKELQKNPKVLKMFYKKRKLEKYKKRKNIHNNKDMNNQELNEQSLKKYIKNYLNEGLFDIFKNNNSNINSANKLALANNIDEDTTLKFANLDLTKSKKLTTKFIQFYIDSNKNDELFNIINQFNQIYNNDPSKVEQVSSTILKLNTYLNFAEYVDSKLGKTADNQILYKNKTWINDDKLAELGITPIYSDSNYSLYLADTEAKAVILTQNRTFCIGRDNGQHNHFDGYRFNGNNEHTFYFLYRKGLVVNPIIKVEVIGINNKGQYQHTDGLNRTKDNIDIDKWLKGKPQEIKELIKANPYNKLELYLKNNILKLEPNKKKYLYNKLIEQYLTNNISGNRLMSLKYIINKSGEKVKEIFIDYIEDRFKEGKSFWVFLVFNNGFGLQYVPNDGYKTEQMCVIGISYYNGIGNKEQEEYMKYIPERVLGTRTFWELLNRDNGMVGEYVKYIPEGLFSGKEIFNLIKNTFEVYERIKRDNYELLIKNLVKVKDVISSKDIVALFNQAIEKNPSLIEYLKEFKDKLSKEQIINLFNQAIEKDPNVIRYLKDFKDKLSSDYIYNLFNQAIEKDPRFLYYLSKFKDKLNSEEIINLFNQAIEKNPNVIEYLHNFKDKLSSDYIYNLFNQAIEKNPNVIEYLHNFKDKLSSDEQIYNLFNQAIEKNPYGIQYLKDFKDKLSSDYIYNLFNQAIEKNPNFIEYLYNFEDKLSNEEIINLFNKAIEKNPRFLYYLSNFKDKLNSEEIINLFNQAIEKDPYIVRYLYDFKDKLTNEEIVNLFNQAIEKDPWRIEELEHYEDKLNKEEIFNLFIKACKININVLQFSDFIQYLTTIKNEDIINFFNKIIIINPGAIYYLKMFKYKLTNEEIIDLWIKSIEKSVGVIKYLKEFTNKLTKDEIESLKQLANNIKNNALLENYIRNKVKNLLKKEATYL